MGRQFENEVFPAEWKEIDESRKRRLNASPYQPQNCEDPYPEAHRLKLAGLAFSGGGIRSATFNLGVIQALAERRLLRHFDYLSTVSGGGYIGSWLTAWIKRESNGVNEVEAALTRPTEPEQIRFLRRYSNYLTPETGFLSADTWTTFANWLRNAFLNLLVLLFAFAAVLLLPRWLLGGAVELAGVSSWNHSVGLALVVLLLLAMVRIGRNLILVVAATDECPRYAELKGVQLGIIVPVLFSTILATWWLRLQDFGKGWSFLEWMGLIGLLYPLLCVPGSFPKAVFTKGKAIQGISGPPGAVTKAEMWFEIRLFLKNLFWAIVAGLIGGLMLHVIAGWMETWRTPSGGYNDLLILTWGPSLMLLLAATVVTLHVGFTGRLLKSEVQEWWLRLSAWLMIYTLAWIVWFTAALYAPFLFNELGQLSPGLQQSSVVGWIVTTVAGILTGKNQKTGRTGEEKAGSWMDLVAKVASYIFVAGFVGLVSIGLHYLILGLFADRVEIAGDWQDYFLQILNTSGFGTFIVFLACTGIAAVLAWRIDINVFSLHFYYRNRLIRCYLGASRGAADRGGHRQPNPFTGFDPKDNLPMAKLSIDLGPNPEPDEKPYVGPYHIVNTALNLAHGENLATQQRKATSFVFTPKFCGYTPSKGNGIGYRHTREYAQVPYTPTDVGPSLGTALAISGAAFSPNMGYHSSPVVAFLLTVFGVRLGVWFGNPHNERPEFLDFGRTPTWKRQGPTFSLPYLVFELFALANDERGFISLSDGGHFENLGLYELIRRRCKYIVVIDAGQDGNYGFEDLGGAIRKCRIDFNTEIDIDVKPLCPRLKRRTERLRKDEKYSERQYAVGKIVYPDQQTGILVYLKPALTGQESTDIRNYASENPAFPHQPTTDQWFNESQFESYRKLGYHIASTAFPIPEGGARAVDLDKYFETVRGMAIRKC